MATKLVDKWLEDYWRRKSEYDYARKVDEDTLRDQREGQLRESIDRNATLTEQVGELTATIGRMRKANDAYLSALDAANAELSALREGIGVEQYLSMKVRAEAADSKLRVESCKHCGPDCIPGAAHNARAEDGVIWTPNPSSRSIHE